MLTGAECQACVLRVQIAKMLELDPAQSTAIVSLWGGYEAQLSRVLETRVAIHRRISATMPNGYMGRDFAIKNFRVRTLNLDMTTWAATLPSRTAGCAPLCVWVCLQRLLWRAQFNLRALL